MVLGLYITFTNSSPSLLATRIIVLIISLSYFFYKLLLSHESGTERGYEETIKGATEILL